MKISRFFDFILDYERKVYVILFILFSVSFAYGCYFSLCGKAGEGELLITQFGEAHLWMNIILKDILCLLITFILGYTVIGFPLLCINIVLYGMYLGIALSRYTYLHGIKGALISGVAFFPYYFVLITSLILLTFSSMRMSVALFNVFKKGTRFISPKTYSVPHIIKCFVFILFNIVVSFVFSYIIYPIINKIL